MTAVTGPFLPLHLNTPYKSGEGLKSNEGLRFVGKVSAASTPPLGGSSCFAAKFSAEAGLALGSLALTSLIKSRRQQKRQAIVARRLESVVKISRHHPGTQTKQADVTKLSLWHDVDLFVRDWLDEPTGLLRYVNEMPMGGLTKYEVQPSVPGNAIREDAKGSQRLAAFGKPVPFNYGCFPQTYRDPAKADELYNAPGDDDPLDVLDLSSTPVGVGSVVQCRPLGAVCLIDEGQADWKILAINVDTQGPLASAQSVDEVERLAPGRIQECLRWIDDFKSSNGKDAAKLHWEVHGPELARSLIESDHASWKDLVAEAGVDGRARGHWICPGSDAKWAAASDVLKPAWGPDNKVHGALLQASSILVETPHAPASVAEPTDVQRELQHG
eukprot:TRINITY_DN7250_c0_g1_i1.p1 TRINITY_DN7250_c0_g1~~TRINITY_DN7250_c0_g1_i1.p1  ORF type:complete len:386 (+),score=69.50 TRINITY_DN7250_c0_g1_i1:94-1251(+)